MTKKTSISIPNDIKERIKALSKREELTVTLVTKILLEAVLPHYEQNGIEISTVPKNEN